MQYIKNRIQHTKSNLLQALVLGHSPHKLALSVTVGLVLGIMPLWGVITVIGLGVGWIFRLHVAILIAVMYLLTPLHVALLVPYFSLSATMFGLALPDLSLITWTGVSGEIIKAFLGAIAIWSVIALPLGYGGYRIMLRILHRYHRVSVV